MDDPDCTLNPQRLSRLALETFGTEEKATHWLNRRNHIFGGKTAIEAMEIDGEEVERELVRIDHGIFI